MQVNVRFGLCALNASVTNVHEVAGLVYVCGASKRVLREIISLVVVQSWTAILFRS